MNADTNAAKRLSRTPKGKPPRESDPGCKQRILTLRLPAELHTRLLHARQTRHKAINVICCELIAAGLDAVIETPANSTAN